MKDKFPVEARTFKTRLEFLRDIYLDLHDPQDILAGSIQHKLDRSFLAYVNSLNACLVDLSREDPLKVLKNMR